MKQSQIIKAYKILDKMNTKVFPIKLVHDLFMLKRALEPHVDFQTEKEQEVYSKYNPVQTENGQNKQDAAQKHEPEPGTAFRFHTCLSFPING